ncbi:MULTISPECIES: ABC transporter substrate-binding protein [unclassified Sulfitobacter]|uniref:ABC transporter substrate-binding protein n=1 Tax=unclassified Sulfitobacter TaxID=196795 RepID=UPI0023E1944C|nr:ABC transporter substrate-binding protein [Sulfitobacter sp. Ks41]MDF3362464.1 ABC transporter substrate-binding protein [Sulfitobacter sp. Ks41]
MKYVAPAVVIAALAMPALAEEVKIGVMLGFTGPVESMTPQMAAAAEMAMKEASETELFLNGSTLTPVRGDSTCIDASAATAAAERLVTSDRVKGIVGAACSGVTTAILQGVARPNGIAMVSPASTSPALSTVEDDGLFFRTSPADTRQGEIMSEILTDRGVKSVAVTFTNNDYGKGLSDAFKTAFEDAGGEVTITASHEDGKSDYSGEVGALASAGGEVLVVVGYIDRGGAAITQQALDSGAFNRFHFADAMIGDALEEQFGTGIDGSTGQFSGTDSPGVNMLVEMVGNEFDGTSAYTPETYDAAALMILAMQAAGSTDASEYKSHFFDVANAPGEKIYPGELDKALKILSEGGEIDYEGGSAVELIGSGESAGNFREIEIIDGKAETVKFR